MSNIATKPTYTEPVDICRQGKQIIIPENMTFKDARIWLERKEREDEQVVRIDETIPCHPLEGAIALAKALKDIYGWTNLVPTPGFFGEHPPQFINMEVGPGINVQVPWGKIVIPKIDGYIHSAIGKKDGRFCYRIVGEIKQKHRTEIASLVDKVRFVFSNDSIYKGKAIRISFPDPSDDFNIHDNCPKFMDLSDVRADELIFDSDVRKLVETSVFTPIKYTAACLAAGIPLKRGVLLEGPYGTGKTLTAKVAAELCEKNGWTFLYLNSVKSLRDAIHFAKNYMPAVIFAEDIDQVLGNQDRDEDTNEILNNIDGIDSKNDQLMVVLTTNHVEKLNKAMLRQGRLDAVIPVRPPNAEAVMKLVRIYGRGLIDENEDLTKVGELLRGRIPAAIREVVERAKLASIFRQQGNMDGMRVAAEDLQIAALGMEHHLKLQETPVDEKKTLAEQFGKGFGDSLKVALRSLENNGLISSEESKGMLAAST